MATLLLLSVAGGQRACYDRPQCHPPGGGLAMSDENTTAVVQGYLDALGALDRDTPPEPIVRALLEQAVRRLEALCGNLLQRSYPRLMQPPLNLQPEEMLSAVVERLLKAMREVR